MTDESPHETVSRILHDLDGAQPQSSDELLPLVYSELKRLANREIAKEDSRNEFEATMLVHEAYMRLVEKDEIGWNGQRHFFGAAAQAMRRILVEQARKRQAAKHGGQHNRITFSKAEHATPDTDEEFLFVEEAVRKLEEADPQKGAIVNLRYYAGRQISEVASLLDLSVSSVEREWRFIRSWLKSELSEFRGDRENSPES